MITVMLIANLLAVPAQKPCEALPSPLRVRLTIASGKWRASDPTIRRLVEETWTPAGLKIAWAADDSKWDAIDFWIAFVHGMPTNEHGSALGIVRFRGDQPGPMARLSIDAALLWARHHQARRMQVPINAITAAEAENVAVVSHIMGYSAAHELGHFVLADKTHAPTGIMRAEFRDGAELLRERVWRLDDRSRQRLQRRMTESCDRRAAR